MPLLSALAILAFIALFGAAVAIFITVRRSRRRREERASRATHASSRSTDAPPPPLPGAPHLRNFPTRLGKHPAAAAGSLGQTEWNPFGSEETNFADLSDPAPGRRRLKPRPRRNRPSDSNDIGD